MNYKDERNKKLEARAALVKTAIDEGRAMTAEENAQYKTLTNEIKDLEETISNIAAEERAIEDNKKPVNEPIYAEARNADSVQNITRKICGSIGGYFQDVHKVKTDPSSVERLAKLNKEVLRFTNAAGMSEGVPADGGALVGTDVSSVLLDKSIEQSKLMSRIFKLPISQNSNAISLPTIDDDDFEMYWDGEGDLLSGTKLKTEPIELKLKNLNGLIYVTNDLLEDAASLEAYIMKKFPERQSKKLDKAIISGTGAGMPLGIINSPAVISVAKENLQGAKTIVPQNIVKMYSRFDGNEDTAVFVANRNTLPQLALMGVAVGTGGMLVYMPPNGLADRPNGTLMGIPLILIEYCKTLGTAGDIMLIDLAEYIMADKGTMKSAASMHVRFEYNEMAFRFTYRCDGQPSKKKARTPEEGTDTVSPFVKLATRA